MGMNYKSILKRAEEFLQAIGPDENEDEIETDIEKRFGNLSEQELSKLILKARVKEDIKILDWYNKGMLADNDAYKEKVKKIKLRLSHGEGPILKVVPEYGQYTVYVDGKRIAGGATHKKALMNAASVFLS